MFCIKCGIELPDEAVFCPSCGKKVVFPRTEVKEKVEFSSTSDSAPVPESTLMSDPVPAPESVFMSESMPEPVPMSESASVFESISDPNSVQQFPNEPIQPRKKKKGIFIGIIAGVIGLLLICVAIAIGILVGGMGKAASDEVIAEIMEMESFDQCPSPIKITSAKITKSEEEKTPLLGIKIKYEYITVKAENEYVTFEGGYIAEYGQIDGKWELSSVEENDEYFGDRYGRYLPKRAITQEEVVEQINEILQSSDEISEMEVEYKEISIPKFDRNAETVEVSIEITGDSTEKTVTAKGTFTFRISGYEGWYLMDGSFDDMNISEKSEADPADTSYDDTITEPTDTEKTEEDTKQEDVDKSDNTSLEKNAPLTEEEIIEKITRIWDYEVEILSGSYNANGEYVVETRCTDKKNYAPIEIVLSVTVTFKNENNTWILHGTRLSADGYANKEYLLGEWAYTDEQNNYYINVTQITNDKVVLYYDFNGETGDIETGCYCGFHYVEGRVEAINTVRLGLNLIFSDTKLCFFAFKADPEDAGWYIDEKIKLTKISEGSFSGDPMEFDEEKAIEELKSRVIGDIIFTPRFYKENGKYVTSFSCNNNFTHKNISFITDVTAEFKYSSQLREWVFSKMEKTIDELLNVNEIKGEFVSDTVVLRISSYENNNLDIYYNLRGDFETVTGSIIPLEYSSEDEIALPSIIGLSADGHNYAYILCELPVSNDEEIIVEYRFYPKESTLENGWYVNGERLDDMTSLIKQFTYDFGDVCYEMTAVSKISDNVYKIDFLFLNENLFYPVRVCFDYYVEFSYENGMWQFINSEKGDSYKIVDFTYMKGEWGLPMTAKLDISAMNENSITLECAFEGYARDKYGSIIPCTVYQSNGNETYSYTTKVIADENDGLYLSLKVDHYWDVQYGVGQNDVGITLEFRTYWVRNEKTGWYVNGEHLDSYDFYFPY